MTFGEGRGEIAEACFRLSGTTQSRGDRMTRFNDTPAQRQIPGGSSPGLSVNYSERLTKKSQFKDVNNESRITLS